MGGGVGPHAHHAFAQGAVDPQHGGQGGHRSDDDHERNEHAEPDEPALGVVVQQRPDPREEGEETQHEGGQEWNGDKPELAHHLAVEQARADEVGQIAVEPLHAVEQRARLLARLELGQDLLHDVVPDRRVHG